MNTFPTLAQQASISSNSSFKVLLINTKFFQWRLALPYSMDGK